MDNFFVRDKEMKRERELVSLRGEERQFQTLMAEGVEKEGK